MEVELIGREIVKSVNANLLANIINDLVKNYDKANNKTFKHLIKCRDKLELVKKLRKNEDEGFESENDSIISNDDSYLVDDHVLKCTTPAITTTDSANSTASPEETNEIINICDVIFCHTEIKFTNIIAWVVKKNLNQTEYRLCQTGVENIKSGLEVIVVRCKNNENLRELCFNYKEQSRRMKLEKGYKNRKVSLDDIKVTNSTLIKSSLLNISNKTINTSAIIDSNRVASTVSLNSLINNKKVETKYNLVQRTDNGVTHIEISHDNKSKLRKEIEGIIVTDVDVSRKDTVRQQESDTPPIRPERRRYIRKKEKTDENNPVTTIGRWKSDPDAKRRSKSVDRLKIIPKKAPMSYRYIDVVNNNLNNTQCGSLKMDQGRRRNSLDELLANNKTSSNLKSVIKKTKKVKNCEPKKVTFSAFATVQVVD